MWARDAGVTVSFDSADKKKWATEADQNQKAHYGSGSRCRPYRLNLLLVKLSNDPETWKSSLLVVSSSLRRWKLIAGQNHGYVVDPTAG
jgi:hypothetical protein